MNEERIGAEREAKPIIDDVAGMNLSRAFVLEVEAIDVATGRVTNVGRLPRGHAQFACVTLDGRIYLIGGETDRSGDRRKPDNRVGVNARIFTSRTDVFDPSTQTWQTAAPLGAALQTAGVVVDGGFIVVPGGYDGSSAHAEVAVFNPRANTWRDIPPLCRAVSAHAAAFLGRHLLLFGDYQNPGELIAYDRRPRSRRHSPCSTRRPGTQRTRCSMAGST